MKYCKILCANLFCGHQAGWIWNHWGVISLDCLGQLQDGSLLRNLRYEAGVHQTQLPRRRRLVCKNTCHQWRRVWTDWGFRHARSHDHHAGVKMSSICRAFCVVNGKFLSHKPLSSNETTGPDVLQVVKVSNKIMHTAADESKSDFSNCFYRQKVFAHCSFWFVQYPCSPGHPAFAWHRPVLESTLWWSEKMLQTMVRWRAWCT